MDVNKNGVFAKVVSPCAAALYQSWAAVVFVIGMLQVAVWTKFCPSLWLFEDKS